mmetsp:Transcript_7853/g.22426  ORF Transcript_7853/g.22426 Transcript_7853/m.22426 type:complete len:942 (+) Transcript_7853:237-3062(+)|eukprot:CAMPEP_0117682416 /NCGR_PEP_ID=MMETSP0804-20121206/19648_1 /TAXON_ID=1074897 /ORGANISM="Tetraselmis astigmatica, Strain CCMP880" /LENGTH=941 /DNA_ID=CAMNT_0005492527 /DNA_START=212 /DNA_END=3037 /DNA_ORIENTATION=+
MRDQRQALSLGLTPVQWPPGSAQTPNAAFLPLDLGLLQSRQPPPSAPTNEFRSHGRPMATYHRSTSGNVHSAQAGLPVEFAVPAIAPSRASRWSRKKNGRTPVFSVRTPPPSAPLGEAGKPEKRPPSISDMFTERPDESALHTGIRRDRKTTTSKPTVTVVPLRELRTADGIVSPQREGSVGIPVARARRASFTAFMSPKRRNFVEDKPQTIAEYLTSRRSPKAGKRLSGSPDDGEIPKHVGFRPRDIGRARSIKDSSQPVKPVRAERSAKSEAVSKVERNAVVSSWVQGMTGTSQADLTSPSSEDSASEDSGENEQKSQKPLRSMRTFEEAHRMAIEDLATRGAAAIRGAAQQGALLSTPVARAVTVESSTWGVALSDLRGQGDQVTTPALTEAIREDLNHRLACAHDSGYLNLTYNQWLELPEQVASFLKHQGHHLKALNLEGNNTFALPDVLDRMSMLVSLNIGGNQLMDIPDSIRKLQCLTTVCLEKNNLSVLPDALAECQALTYLDLSHNNIMWLPDSLHHLKKLITLKVCHNKMCHLPEQICEMTSLQEINASHNTITGIPPELGNLVKLESLHLNHNKLTALPATMGALWRSLVELDVRHNYLTVLPASLAACKKLEILELGSNPLIVPPMEVVRQGVTSVLKHLSMTISDSRQRLQAIPSRLQGPAQSSDSKRTLAALVTQVNNDIRKDSPRNESGSSNLPGPNAECGSCVQLHKEIADWKQEIRGLVAQLEENEESIEALSRDGAEIREIMTRKQNRLREMEEAMQTVARERDDAIKRAEKLEQELQGQLVANTDSKTTALGLQFRLEELESQKAELQHKLEETAAQLAASAGEVAREKAKNDSGELEELRRRSASAEEACKHAEAGRAASRQASAAREAELLAKIQQLEQQARSGPGPLKAQENKQVLKGGMQMNFDAINGFSGGKKAGRK